MSQNIIEQNILNIKTSLDINKQLVFTIILMAPDYEDPFADESVW